MNKKLKQLIVDTVKQSGVVLSRYPMVCEYVVVDATGKILMECTISQYYGFCELCVNGQRFNSDLSAGMEHIMTDEQKDIMDILHVITKRYNEIESKHNDKKKPTSKEQQVIGFLRRAALIKKK